MSLYTKLLLFMVAVALGPLALLGTALVSSAEDALRLRIAAAQAEAVRAEADAVARFIQDQVHVLGRTASHFRLEESSEAEREKAVQLLYRSSVHVAFAALLYEDGTPAAPVVFYADPQRAPELSGDPLHFDDLRLHPPSTPELVTRAEVPLDAAKQEGAGAYVLSNVYAVPERNETAFAVALPVRGPDERLLIYVAEVSLGALMSLVAKKQELGTAVVTDATGLTVAHPDPSQLRVDPRLDSSDGGFLRASVEVPLAHLGWRVTASLPEATAFAPIQKLRSNVAVAGTASLALLLLLAAAFTTRVRSGLRAVVEGAAAFAKGDLAHRIVAPPERELRELASAFNSMGEELLGARAQLVRWNEELEHQVEERTQQLKEAQARLVQSQKLAAVGQLGAGVAHEINNPLSGVLGFVQLLKTRLKKAGRADDDPDVTLLDKIETNARRCREVTATLLRFSQKTGEAEEGRVELARVVADALALHESQLAEEGVDVEIDVPADVVVRGEAGQLTQVLLHLVTNARTAMANADEKRLSVRACVDGGRVHLEVEDTGKGMAPDVKERAFEPFFTTKDVWASLGLGLYASFRIVEDHGGRMELDSAPGAGTRARVELPRAEAEGENLRERERAG